MEYFDYWCIECKYFTPNKLQKKQTLVDHNEVDSYGDGEHLHYKHYEFPRIDNPKHKTSPETSGWVKWDSLDVLKRFNEQ